jgi:hydroxyacylglutathione hydrolase
MLVRRIVAPGIAHYSYLIGSGGVAAVIDPRRDCEVYKEIANKNGCVISHIFETHRHEDFLTGSLDLAALTGAEIYHGAGTAFQFGTAVRDGDSFSLGDITIEVRETPGHTRESISLVVREKTSGTQVYMIFSGDALFAGDTGRTDFYGSTVTPIMADALYRSIHDKILADGDGVILCPAHGAGSVCGTAISDRALTTTGYERQTNANLALSKEAFIAGKVAEHHHHPPYFARMETLNTSGPPLLHGLPELAPCSVRTLAHLIKEGAQALDIRAPSSFGGGHIPGSISLWRDGVPVFAGWVLSYDRPVVIIDDFNLGLAPVVRALIRLGYDQIEGYLEGGFPAWSRSGRPISHMETLSVQSLAAVIAQKHPFVLDVRDEKNRAVVGAIEGSHHIYVGEVAERISEVPKDAHVILICDAGYKGSLAGSLLLAAGYQRVSNVLGGMAAWVNAGFPVV